jgi:ABC-type nitrate/sulfonate/bicarbonate transport system ATPase subunit
MAAIPQDFALLDWELVIENLQLVIGRFLKRHADTA